MDPITRLSAGLLWAAVKRNFYQTLATLLGGARLRNCAERCAKDVLGRCDAIIRAKLDILLKESKPLQYSERLAAKLFAYYGLQSPIESLTGPFMQEVAKSFFSPPNSWREILKGSGQSNIATRYLGRTIESIAARIEAPPTERALQLSMLLANIASGKNDDAQKALLNWFSGIIENELPEDIVYGRGFAKILIGAFDMDVNKAIEGATDVMKHAAYDAYDRVSSAASRVVSSTLELASNIVTGTANMAGNMYFQFFGRANPPPPPAEDQIGNDVNPNALLNPGDVQIFLDEDAGGANTNYNTARSHLSQR